MSGFLLDTHNILWLAQGSSELSESTKDQIRSSGEPVFVSTISAWEIAIKVSLGKLTLNIPIDELFGPRLR